MKTFEQFINESAIKPGKAYIINHGYEELDRPKDNYVLVGTADGKLSVLLNSLYKLISKYDTILMYDVIFCDAGGSKIQIWVDKDTIDELNHVRGSIAEYAVMQAADMIDEATPMVTERAYEKVWDILCTFEAANDDGQKWYDQEAAFWEEIEYFYADCGYK